MSVDNQVGACRMHAAQKGWDIGDVFSDNSISATKGRHRPGFEAMLARVSPRPVLVHNTDRLIRTMKELERVLETEITVYAVIAGTMDLASSQGRMVARLLTSVAQNEGELKAERMMLSYAARAARGEPFWRQPPLGHTSDGTIIPEEAIHVSEAVKGILDGSLSCREIARRWNNEGVPTTRHATRWTGATVRSALANPRIAGVLYFKGQRMPVSRIGPIVSEERFDALYALFTAPERMSGTRRGLSNLLSGIARCGRCEDGGTIHGTTAETDGGRGPVYRCARGHNQHHRGEADSVVIGRVLEELSNDPTIFDGDADDIDRAEMQRLRGQIAKWQAKGSEIDPDDFLAVVSPLRTELRALESKNRDTSLARLLNEMSTSFRGMESLVFDAIKLAEWWELLGLTRQRVLVDHLLTVTLLPRQRWSKGPRSDYVVCERRE